MKLRRILAPLVLASVFATSCVGPYNAFNSVASWNSRVSDSKFLNELVYIGLNIIPVYGLASLGDALIFNSIEFWGGENPIKAPEDFTPQGDK